MARPGHPVGMSWNGKPTAPPLGAVRGGNGRAGAARSNARTRALEWPLTGEAGRWGCAERKGLQWRAERHTDTRLALMKPSGLGADQRHPVHPGALPRRGLRRERAQAADEPKGGQLDVVLGPIRAVG